MRAWIRPLVAATLIGVAVTPVLVASPATAAAPVVIYERRVVTVVEGIDGPIHRSVEARCERNEVATGGGWDVRGTTNPSAYTVFGSEPTGTGWLGQIFVDAGFGHDALHRLRGRQRLS